MPSRPEVTRERKRIERALAYAQRVLGTGFHFTVMPDPEADEDTYLTCDQSARGDQDKNHFIIGFHYDNVKTLARKDLRRKAGHEVGHALHWEVETLAEAGKKGAALDSAIAASESFIYAITRVIFGDENK